MRDTRFLITFIVIGICVGIPLMIFGCVRKEPQALKETVFQTLADEIDSDGSGRRVWFKNTMTGECFLSARMNSGTALTPALCENKKK